MSELVDKRFVETFLLSKNGNLNPRALEKYNISKELAYQIANDMHTPPHCQECSSTTTFLSFKKGYTNFCSNKCASKSSSTIAKKQKTLIDHYGINPWSSIEIQDKKKATSMSRYGVAWATQSVEVQDKKKAACLEKHGISNVCKLPRVVKKREQTCLEKYGVTNPSKLDTVKNKRKSTNLEKYGVTTPLLLSQNKHKALDTRRDQLVYEKLNDIAWLEHNKSIPSTLLSEQLGVALTTILNYYEKHNVIRPHVIVSKYELQISEFLDVHNISHTLNDRIVLDGKEIDIYLPEFKVGIELDGLYWHSEKFIKDTFYHYNKTQLATKKGIQLIHILDYEWINKNSIVKERLLAKLKKTNTIYARKCNIVVIDNNKYANFVTTHHIQGTASASVRLGLEYKNELVAVMSFSKARYNKKFQWELIRYASVGTVVGGASRLFKSFIKQNQPSSIISYSDNRWNTGKVYDTIGMCYSHSTGPNYWYHRDGEISHRTTYQKHKLKNKLDLYDENLTEWENMKSNGFDRYWDCGNNVYTWKKDEN